MKLEEIISWYENNFAVTGILLFHIFIIICLPTDELQTSHNEVDVHKLSSMS